MKSLIASAYVDDAVKSIPSPVQVPSGNCRTAERTRAPGGADVSYEKHNPETWGKRPCESGIDDTPFSRKVFSSAPFTTTVTAALLNGRTASTCPRVIRLLGGAGGQKPLPPPASGQVRSARSPPEFVMAKSTPYRVRIASVTASPTNDSHVRPSGRPHESVFGIARVALPITALRI